MMSLLDLLVKEKCGIGQLVSHYIRPILLRRYWRRVYCYLPMPALSPKLFPLNRQNSALSCFCWGFVKRDTRLLQTLPLRLWPTRRPSAINAGAPATSIFYVFACG